MIRASSRFWFWTSIIIAAVTLFAVSGCGGSCTLDTGGVSGWVYQLPDGTGVMITGDRIPPEGYVPAVGNVYIEGNPELNHTLDANGRYVILGIKPGDQTVIVEDDEGTELARIAVTVRIGHCVIGGGHSEGGGEI